MICTFHGLEEEQLLKVLKYDFLVSPFVSFHESRIEPTACGCNRATDYPVNTTVLIENLASFPYHDDEDDNEILFPKGFGAFSARALNPEMI